MRVSQHITDTKTIKHVLNAIPDHWIVRELTERDYGTDLMLEIFQKSGIDHLGNDVYKSTGHICYLQLKGTEDEIEYKEDRTLGYSIDRETLLYVERFSTPFLLLRVSVAKGKEKIHFLWLQRYIMDVLDMKIPDWRNKPAKKRSPKSSGKQESFTLRIPATNVLVEKLEKIEEIAARIKCIEEHVEFSERWEDVQNYLKAILANSFEAKAYSHLFALLYRLANLTTLFQYNTCNIDLEGLQELITYVKLVQTNKVTPREEEDYPNWFKLDLLKQSLQTKHFIENFVHYHFDTHPY